MHSEKSNNLSAPNTQKALGGEQTVGDVLNKVADPNWVDPSKKVRKAGNAQLDKDAFLKLMLAQMKFQDPTKPMESHEMAAQLAQFTSLEQLNNIHTTLESMKTAQSPSVNYQALAFIGKKISTDSSKVTRNTGDTEHAMRFQLLGDADKIRVTVKDAGGNAVRKIDLTNLKKGENSVKWNGLSDDGISQRPGEYHITIEAQGASGAKVYARTQFEGRITGLNYTPEGPVLMVGNQTVRMSEVKKIEEVGNDAQPPPVTPLAPRMPSAIKDIGAVKQTAAMTMGALNMGAMNTAAMQSSPKLVMKPVVKEPTKFSSASSTATQEVAQAGRGLKSESLTQDSKLAKSSETIKETENVPPAEEPALVQNNIDSVPMASALLNKINAANSLPEK